MKNQRCGSKLKWDKSRINNCNKLWEKFMGEIGIIVNNEYAQTYPIIANTSCAEKMCIKYLIKNGNQTLNLLMKN